MTGCSDWVGAQGEAPFFQKERIIKKTRKEHVCKETKTVIPVGSEALYYVRLTAEYGFQYYYTHSEATLQKMFMEASQ